MGNLLQSASHASINTIKQHWFTDHPHHENKQPAIVANHLKKAAIFGYIRLNYQQTKQILLFPQELKLIIMSYTKFGEP